MSLRPTAAMRRRRSAGWPPSWWVGRHGRGSRAAGWGAIAALGLGRARRRWRAGQAAGRCVLSPACHLSVPTLLLALHPHITPQAKKVAKHLQKHSTGGAGYSNEDNPFGDANLSDRFVWGKKIEKQLAEGVDVRELTAKAETRRHAERLEEIEKVGQLF